HEPRVRVRRQAAAGVQFAAEVLELGRLEPAFEVGAGVNAGRGVALEVDLVAAAWGIGAAQEVILGHLAERRGRGKGRDVAADAVLLAVGANDHGHRIPAHQVLDAALDLAAAGVRRLAVGRDGVDVGRAGANGDLDTAADRLVLELVEQEAGTIRAGL